MSDHGKKVTQQDLHRICACGCGGKLVKPPGTSRSHFAKIRYIKGHSYTPETRAKMSEGLKKAHAAGKFDHLKTSKPVAKWGSAEHLEKLKATMLRGPQHLTKAQETKRRDNIRKARTGTFGYGKNRRDNPHHRCAKEWEIRSPDGKYYRIKNLMSWCRRNIHLFHDPSPDAKTPLERRAALGIAALGHARGKDCSWAGWTLVSSEQFERDVFGTPITEEDD